MAEPSTLLPPTWEVPQEFRNRLGKQVGRQRAMVADGHLLLILHQPPASEHVKRVGRYFWRKPDGSWVSSDLGHGPRALGRHLDEYAEVLEKYDKQEEEAAGAEDYFAVLEALGPVHRSVRHLHQTLQEARKAVPKARDLIDFRDRAYEIERTAELLYSETHNGLNFTMARQSEQQAKNSRRMAVSAYRLNLLAAFFFPLATLAALFGVNLEHGFENAAAPLPFLGVVVFGLILGFVLQSFVTQDSYGPSQGGTHADGRRGPDRRKPGRVETGPSRSDRPLARR